MGIFPTSSLVNIPTRLKTAREQKKVKQTEIAKIAGVSRGKIVKTEHQKATLGTLDLNVLNAYSIATGYSEFELLFGINIDEIKAKILLRVNELNIISKQNHERSLSIIEEELAKLDPKTCELRE